MEKLNTAAHAGSDITASQAGTDNAASQAGTTTGTAAHLSSPIPVQGPAVGSGIRVNLGETPLSVFPLILGGAEFGWNVNRDDSHAIIDTFIERGGNTIHTADSYVGGRSELIIGQWVASRRAREDVILATRVGAHPDNPGLGSINLVRAVEASLTRLDVERIDVLYLDGAGADGPLEDTLATAEWLVERGKVGSVGAYRFSAAQLVEARILSAAGYPRLAALDVPYNVLRRADLTDDLKLVVNAQSMALTPSHPLEHGFLAGATRSRPGVVRSVRGAQMLQSLTKRGTKTLRALDAIGDDLGVPDAAVAIAWLLSQKIVTAPIVNAFTAAHVEELVQGVGVRLGRSHLSEIARASQ